jgi:hypothetical protein
VSPDVRAVLVDATADRRRRRNYGLYRSGWEDNVMQGVT